MKKFNQLLYGFLTMAESVFFLETHLAERFIRSIGSEDRVVSETAVSGRSFLDRTGAGSGKEKDRKSTRLNSSHEWISRMPSSA